MKKLFLTISLVACQVFSMAAYDFSSQTKYSVEEALDSVWLYYSINPDNKSVSVTIGPEVYKFNHIRIPETVTHNNTTYTVTEIAYNAFNGGNINVVEMANTITKIGDYAFASCDIDSIKFSTSLKAIGNNAFRESSLRAVVLPEGLETIGESAFEHTTNWGGNPLGRINYISFPSSLTDMGESAFQNNGQLKAVAIPEKITDIKPYTFAGCHNLETVHLPSNLKNIGDYAFMGCAIQQLDADFFSSQLEIIGDGVFQGSKIKRVVLPNNIKSIGRYCFHSCSLLESITFSSGMTELPEKVCSSCTKLVDVTIPNSITKIGNSAFGSNKLLSHIELPATITEIGYSVFESSGLVTFSFPPLVDEIKSETFSHCSYLTDIKIPNSIKTIGSYAFEYCEGLINVEIDEGIDAIGECAFRWCSSLKNLKLPSSITKIGKSAFYSNTSLESVVLPENLTTIDNNGFQRCTSLKNIQFNDKLTTIGANSFDGCSAIESINLPHSLETLGTSAFYNCTSLTKITIPHTVSYFGSTNFYGCTNLKEVHYKRAILPSGLIGNNSKAIEDGNQCTLYVPIGSKATYEASINWNNFDTIVEEEIGYDILYRVSVTKTGNGSVTVNESTAVNNDIISGTDVKLSITPQSGWKIKIVKIDNSDVTAECVDGKYEIPALAANVSVVVVFEEIPANLQLKQADGGSISVAVVKGSTFTCVFSIEDGWKINNVRYNNNDVTSSLTENNEYTTPIIRNNAILSVAYEKQDGAVDASFIDKSKVIAYITAEGVLVIEGAEDGKPINVITSDGKVVSTLISKDGRAACQLGEHGVYVVKTITKAIKVGY